MTLPNVTSTGCPHIHRNDDDYCPCSDPVEPATCEQDGCYEYVEQDEPTCGTHTYDPFEVEIWNEVSE